MSPALCFFRDLYLVYRSRRDSRRCSGRHPGAHANHPASRSKARFHVLATRLRASFGKATAKPGRDGPQNRGERSAERRRCLVPRVRGAAAHLAIGALAFRRSTAALARASERSSSAQAVLHAIDRQRERYPRRRSRLSGTPRAPVVHAGGIDAQAARERGYKPRPREPHSLHQSAVTGRRPSMSEMVGVIVIAAAKSKGFKFSSINQGVSHRRFRQKYAPRA